MGYEKIIVEKKDNSQIIIKNSFLKDWYNHNILPIFKIKKITIVDNELIEYLNKDTNFFYYFSFFDVLIEIKSNANSENIENFMEDVFFIIENKENNIYKSKEPLKYKEIALKRYGNLSNQLKNAISCIRISNYFNIKCIIDGHECLINKLFDNNEYKIKVKDYKDLFARGGWRLNVLNIDKNIDIAYENIKCFKFNEQNDFQDDCFFRKFNNNCIDLMYNSDLFGNIYQEYSDIFNSLKIKEHISNEVNNFSKKLDKNTISVHMRTWPREHHSRKDLFKIDNFLNKIDELDNENVKFFVSSDSLETENKVIDHQKRKNKNNVITYNKNKDSNVNFRDYEIGMINLLLLSKSNILIGSYTSTFTEMSYLINYNKDKKVFIL
tara:strand:- start:2633 stop:3775 length:1143 start_codon:yes stop_codon:yes gene_type:complete